MASEGPWTPAPGIPMPFSGLCVPQSCMWYTDTHAGYTHLRSMWPVSLQTNLPARQDDIPRDERQTTGPCSRRSPTTVWESAVSACTLLERWIVEDKRGEEHSRLALFLKTSPKWPPKRSSMSPYSRYPGHAPMHTIQQRCWATPSEIRAPTLYVHVTHPSSLCSSLPLPLPFPLSPLFPPSPFHPLSLFLPSASPFLSVGGT